MAKQPTVPITTTPKGIMTALGAFIIWGGFPLYFKQLQQYDAIEIIVHRIVWTCVCLLIFMLMTRRFSWVQILRQQPKWLLITVFSGFIITSNWLTYVWAVNANQILAASLGYFISPLVGVALSMLVFHERLRPLQWLAIAIASVAVMIQVAMLGSLPWVSLVLAASFGVYGIMQRKTPLAAVDALFLETIAILPVCLLWLLQADVASSQLSFWWSNDIGFLMLAGPITLVPLLLFNKSTKMVAYSVLSFMNYLSPSFIFLLAVFYYHEPFDHQRLIVFVLIWLGLVVFSVDLWRHRPSKKASKKTSKKALA